MSTEFRSTTTGELAFVRWAGHWNGSNMARFEFGTMTNWEAVRAAAASGDTFEHWSGECEGDPDGTAEWFDTIVRNGRASFGDFGITVEVGSGELWRFTVEQ